MKPRPANAAELISAVVEFAACTEDVAEEVLEETNWSSERAILAVITRSQKKR
jgi:hypothetical protein